MREYAKVTPAFWTGQTGQRLRGKPDQQLAALYLMTSRHANMIGVFTLPVSYLAHETGMTLEGASKALRSLSKEGFIALENSLDLVWVTEMARVQVGEALKPADKQVKGVLKQFNAIPKCRIKWRFFERYQHAFHLPWTPETEGLRWAFKGASKVLRSQEQEQEQYANQEGSSLVSGTTTSTGASVPALKVVA